MISAGDRVFDVRSRLAGTVVSVDRLGAISVAFVRYGDGEIRASTTLGLRRIGWTAVEKVSTLVGTETDSDRR